MSHTLGVEVYTFTSTCSNNSHRFTDPQSHYMLVSYTFLTKIIVQATLQTMLHRNTCKNDL